MDWVLLYDTQRAILNSFLEFDMALFALSTWLAAYNAHCWFYILFLQNR